MLRYLNPLTYFKWIGQFIYAWGMSLPWSNAPLTIPALILILLISLAAVIAFSGNSNNWRSNLLKKQLTTAFDADDFETAELLLARQVNDRPNDGDLEYRLALIQNEQGKKEEATMRMERLVSTKRHKEAARWIVQTKFDKRKWQDLEAAEKDEFGNLTKLMYEEYENDPGAQSLYADYLIASGSLTKAMPVLEELARRNPLRGLQAAAVARQLGNEERATAIAQRSLATVSAMSEEDPRNLAISMAVARSQVFLKQFEDSINTLAKAVKLAKTPEEEKLARGAYGDAIVEFVNHIENSSAGSIEDRVRILEMMKTALNAAPTNPRVLTLVSNQVLATLGEDDEQIAAVRRSLVSGVSPGVSHFIRGTAALMKNNQELATRELKLASELMPLSSAVMNNLAVVMTRNKNVDPEQPLKMINEAIKISKNSPPHYYETRGQILMLMERYEEAIPDLERALAVESLAKKAHTDLALCYEKIGDPEVAQAHRQAAEDFDQTVAKETAERKALEAEAQEAEEKAAQQAAEQQLDPDAAEAESTESDQEVDAEVTADAIKKET